MVILKVPGMVFAGSIRHNWGSHPFCDLETCLDYVLNKYSYLDSERVAGLGASYGGYITNWINSNSNKFKTPVNHDDVSSAAQVYYITASYFGNRFSTHNLDLLNIEAIRSTGYKQMLLKQKAKPVCKIFHKCRAFFNTTINNKHLEDKFFEAEEPLNRQTFQQHFNYGVFYTCIKLRRQEARNAIQSANAFLKFKKSKPAAVFPNCKK
ncbi:hypothetical protein G6F46_002202 [Rhizopus delemar]|uniref:Peptidase S9 prolyl oligopeptidase catalytic domain-containing protein n=1 Tax=Rhizopus oryzae TaxID=64495 RepID=A0A9P6YPY4_RHIOR|nr:hypothetical protein G6F55_001270 [Rhizopus delemar]KAG1553467.1 hypothetical protein G6F51_000578 [Rhizopus arrhizus]KAG1503433.1 hypothetical protein G6F54_001677 [Rhizopus delemar]KAG1516849.1 hypothetical protein G6F53_001837 [Rhizopus delemar]KAG1620694.1 hypothetical protein G6F46_002202 [Rhizopus delemar]